MSTGCKCACCREKSSEEGSLLVYEDVSDPEGIKDGAESEVFAWEATRLAEYYALSCTNFIVPGSRYFTLFVSNVAIWLSFLSIKFSRQRSTFSR